MALRHAVLAALLDGEFSGYQLAKGFDIGVANFWHALPQQLYAELSRLESDGLVSGREVVQDGRPNKRMFRVTDEGVAELERFAAAPAKPSFIRDDLLVKVQAVDGVDAAPVIAQLQERAAVAEAKAEVLGKLLLRLRGELDEAEFLLAGQRIGPYLTCQRGLAFERETREWCLWAAELLLRRQSAGRAGSEPARRRPAG
ncbi:PadR family transcriptional regulator [Streptomyces sp. NPDC127108]|uniref:PadR family transcriptional regulator n=1 Tax=Streptomyces sp. NPDC127108 TaxID=3345361 RepID=UPI0036328F88